MNEPSARQRQAINLDEFERRLGRPAAPNKDGDDPLAELARLVNAEDRFKTVFQRQPAAPGKSPARQNDWLTGPASRMPRLGGDFASIEAGLRGSIVPEFQASQAPKLRAPAPSEFRSAPPEFRAAPEPDFDISPAEELRAPAQAYHSQESETDFYADAEDWLDSPYVQQPEPRAETPRSRLPLYATAAVILLGMAGIGATFALKRTSVAPHEIAMIKAAPGPVKIQASDTADVSKPDQIAAVLDNSAQPAPTAAVSHSEEPVDLGSAQASAEPVQQAPQSLPPGVQMPAAAQALPGPQTLQSQQGQTEVASAAPGGAAVVPVPAPPAAESQGQAFGLAGVIEPKKVKTVTVRPDGTIVSDDNSQQAAMAPISPVGALPAEQPSASAPGAPDAPSAAAQPPAPPAAAAPAAAGEQPPAPPAAPAPAAAGGDSAAPSGASASEQSAPAQPEENLAEAGPAKDATGDDSATQPAASHLGGFDVQLAAPATEAEARQAMTKLQRKYGGELSGYHLKYHLASVANKTVYRVRVVGLSHEEAVALCQKLEGRGGTCFVAKN